MAICVCRYPLVIVDRRDGNTKKDEKLFLSLPVEILTDKYIPTPEIDLVKEKGFDGIERDYVKVKWRDIESKIGKRYNVHDHIVVAGCPEDQLTCDEKNIYEVYHPLEEWESIHIIEIGMKD